MNNAVIQFHPQASNKLRLTEAGQTLKVEFAWLHKLDKNTYESQTPWILCRDYFNEIWQRCFYGNTVKPKEVYGFTIDNLDVRGEDAEHLYLALSYAKVDYNPTEHFNRWLETFNKIEESNGFAPTQVVGVNEDERFFIVRASRQWMDNPTLLGILTLSLRMMCYKTSAQFDGLHPYEYVLTLTSDNKDNWLIVNSIKPYAKPKHLEVLKAIFYNFSMWSEMNQKHASLTHEQMSQQEKDWDQYIMHNSTGIVSVVQQAMYFDGRSSEFKDKLLTQLASFDAMKKAA